MPFHGRLRPAQEIGGGFSHGRFMAGTGVNGLRAMCSGNKWYKVIYLVPVVQRLDNAIHRINHYPVDSVVCFVNTYPLESDLSSG